MLGNLKRLAFALALAAIALPAAAQDKPLRVGVTAGPHAQIFELVKKLAEAQGLKLTITEFSDYVQPNAALAQGDLDVNSYQHQPYLDQMVADRGYKLVSVAQTVIFPIGLYSKKVKSLADLPTGGRIAIPNDPTNGGRVLLLLERQGLIKLKPGAGLKASVVDITDSPKKLRIIELDAAQLPRSLDDVDAAAVNTNFAIQAGLLPTRDALVLEDGNSPYANILVVRTVDEKKPEVLKLVSIYRSPEVKKFIDETFQKSVLATW